MKHCKQILLLIAGISFTLTALGQQKNPNAENPLNKQSWNQSNTTTHQKPRFEPNKGQIADHEGNVLNELEYVYRAPGMKMGLKQNGFVYNLYTVEKKENKVSEATGQPKEQRIPSSEEEVQQEVTYHYHRVEVQFLNANEDVKIKAENKTEAYANYYLGHCPQGITNVHSYQKLTYQNLYDNIDLVLTRKQNEEGQEQLKYDIKVHPGGDLSEVKMAYKGMDDLSGNNGHLQITTSQGQMTETIPESYWEESQEAVAVNYQVEGNVVKFQAQQKQKGKTLVVDPALSWSTFLGGGSSDKGKGVATDNNGNAFVSGWTESSNFPTTNGAYQTSLSCCGPNNKDAFLSKFTSGGSLSWSTFLGGNSDDYVNEVATDGNGNAFVTGFTESSNFPTTNTAYQTSYGDSTDAFVSKFSSGGNLKWSTFLGGSGLEEGFGIATDGNGNTFVTGETNSINFPGTNGAYQPSLGGVSYYYGDAFLSKFSTSGSLIWSTYLGGGSEDIGNSVATDKNGNAFVTGGTRSSNFPTTIGAYQPSFGGGYLEGFLSKFTSGGSLSWSTFLGGSGSEGKQEVATDSSGNAFVSGWTGSSNFPTTSGAYQPSWNGGVDAFLSKFSSGGSLSWSTFLGDSDDDDANGIATDGNGNALVTGQTRSSNFPTTNCTYQPSYGGGYYYGDAFLSKFTSGGNLDWSTFLGGSDNDYGYAVATDSSGNAFVTGQTASSNFPTTNGAYQPSLGGGNDAFLSKFYFGDSTSCCSAGFISDSACLGKGVQLVDNSTVNNDSITHYNWELGNGDTATGVNVNHIYATPGNYNVTLIVSSDSGCTDSISKSVKIKPVSTGNVSDTACDSYTWPANGQTYSSGGTYMDTLTNNAGCDSVVTLNLTINNSNSGSETITACDSYTWPANGQTYTSSGTFEDTLTNNAGCDSVVTLNLTINNSNSGTETITACDSYTWPATGQTYTSSGTFEDTLTNDAGCDSVVTLNLTIKNSNSGSETITACDSYTWPANGQTYTSSGTFEDTLTNNAGCDSVVTLNLTINNSNSGTETITACDSYTWPANGQSYTSSGSFEDTLTNNAGCDSVVTLNLTINNSNSGTETITACDSYTWPATGQTYTSSGTFEDTLTNNAGCDSVGTLNLTINNSNSRADTITACGSYTVPSGDETYTSSGTYHDTITNELGCDSTLTLNLTINNATSSTLMRSVCDSFTFPSGQQTIKQSGIYYDTVTNSQGCDSTITMSITVNTTSYDTFSTSACNSYTAPSGDETHNSSGTYHDTLTQASGCDSILTVNLTIQHSTTATINPTTCESYTVPSGDETYTSTGMYSDTIQNNHGCDSILTISLDIKDIDTSVSQIGNELKANDTSGAYQWLSCDTNGFSKITGATAQTYEVEEDGNYAVTITNGPCTDTSNCHEVTVASLASVNVNSEIDIYPNPTRGTYWVDLNKQHSKVIVKVQNWAGQAIAKRELTNVEEFEGKLKGKAGIYFVNIFTENGKMARKKILKLY